MIVTRVLLAIAVIAYVVYGLKRFGRLDRYTSPRFVRHPPPSGLWGPVRFLSRDTWTEEGLRERNRVLVWQIGFLVIIAVAGTLWR
jgi:hypothetical protein